MNVSQARGRWASGHFDAANDKPAKIVHKHADANYQTLWN